MSFSEKAARYLIKSKGINDEDQKEILLFGAQVFFGLLSGTFITLLVGYLLNVHIQVFFMLLASLFIRKTAGGAHSENPLHCLLITVFIYNILALIALETIHIIRDYNWIIFLFTFFCGIIIVYYKSPVESPQKPLSYQQRTILRNLSLLVVFSLFVFQWLMKIHNKYELTNYAVSLILAWQYLMLTSFGHKIMLLLDRFLCIIFLNRR